MPRAKKKPETEETYCYGGNSFGCDRTEHIQSKRHPHITCYRCGERMGCYLCVHLCVQVARELLCLRCHDWGHPAALLAHGPIVADREIGAESFRICLMILRGRVSQDDGEKLIAELFEAYNRPQRQPAARAEPIEDRRYGE